MTDVAKVAVPHVVRGRVLEPYGDDAVDYGGFVTPPLDLDELVWPRAEAGPAFDLPVDDIIDFLVVVGARLDLDTNEHLKHALECSLPFSGLGPRVLAQAYRGLPAVFEKASLEFQVEQEVGRAALDGWAEVRDPNGRVRRVRAFPPRLVHVLAGNTPGVTGITVARGALTKGVHLLKLPSNDLLTGTAILRTMAEVDPEHPVTQSFSCVYWRGGDTAIEGALYRAQFFDRLVAWGGDAAIRSALAVHRARVRPRVLRPEGVGLVARPRGAGLGRHDRGVRARGRDRRGPLQPGGLRREPLHLRRGWGRRRT